MEVLLAAVVLVGLCVVGLCFNIIFRKGGTFPETEISRNKELRKRGIVCAKEEEIRLWRKKKTSADCRDICGDCHECEINKC